ncbi:SNF2-related protein [Comamonas aquatica]|uniref:SNF2-related protein n=1 Tax=Comamonas aquatica TaxID=225991 RepID=UPI001C3F29A7
MQLDAFLNAVRWGAVSQTDTSTLQAPFRAGIEIEDYQLDPLARAIQMPRVNLLIADDVGLGKTIESGLVVQELMLRHRIRSVLIVCPSGLQIQWREQMRDKFGLDFRIVDSEAMKQLRRSRGLHVNPWSHYPRLITSIDFLKRERPLRLMREVLYVTKGRQRLQDVESTRPLLPCLMPRIRWLSRSGVQPATRCFTTASPLIPAPPISTCLGRFFCAYLALSPVKANGIGKQDCLPHNFSQEPTPPRTNVSYLRRYVCCT